MAHSAHVTKKTKPTGIILIGAGAILFLTQIAGFDILPTSIPWPFYIVAPGVLLLALSSYDKTIGEPLAPLGMIITVTGCLLAYQTWADHYQSWAYAWILTGPFSVGAGFVLHGVFHGDKHLIEVGRKLALLSAAFFLAAAVIFELVFNISGFGLSIDLSWGFLLPTMLVGVGVFVLFRQPNQAVSALNPPAENTYS